MTPESKDAAMLREALQELVDLDDGDEPLAWKYSRQFGKARAALAASEPSTPK